MDSAQRFLNRQSRMLLAMQHQDLKQLRNIFKEPNFDPDVLFNVAVDNEMPALCLALHRRLPKVAKLLIEAGASVNRTDSTGRAPVHYAVTSELIDLLEPLVSARADINAFCPPGLTAIHLACQVNKPHIVKKLIDLGANPSIRCFQGWDALGFACYYQNTDVVKTLLHHTKTNVNQVYNKGETPLIVALQSRISFNNDHASIVRWLLERGADPNLKTSYFQLPLHAVIDRCSQHDLAGLQMVDMLLKHGAKRNMLTSDGKNVIFLAASRLLDNVCRRLLLFSELPYDRTPEHQNALLEAIFILVFYERIELLRLLFEANYTPAIRQLLKDFNCKLPTMQNKCRLYIDQQIKLAGQPLSLKQMTRLSIRRTFNYNLTDVLKHYTLPESLVKYLELDEL